VTGKPAGDDLRRGKPTVLLSLAAPRLSGSAASTLRQAGSPAMSAQDVVVLQDAMVNAGVRTEMETLISRHVEEAIVCLNGGALHPSGVAGLTELTKALAWRTS
jgi:geranylgeranyl diphosphate synthase type I